MPKNSSQVYKLQNVAIHAARAQLEAQGVLDPWSGLDQIRDMAAELNLGVRSISSLNLEQRRALIDQLIEKGAQVRNPVIYSSDMKAAGGPRKVVLHSRVTESQLRMLDSLAAKVHWRSQDGYLRFCHKVIKCPRPHNSRQVTIIRAALESLLNQQAERSMESL